MFVYQSEPTECLSLLFVFVVGFASFEFVPDQLIVGIVHAVVSGHDLHNGFAALLVMVVL